MAPSPAEDDPGRGEAADEALSGAPPEEGHDDDDVDEASEESFPASDAPASWSGPSDG